MRLTVSGDSARDGQNSIMCTNGNRTSRPSARLAHAAVDNLLTARSNAGRGPKGHPAVGPIRRFLRGTRGEVLVVPDVWDSGFEQIADYALDTESVAHPQAFRCWMRLKRPIGVVLPWQPLIRVRVEADGDRQRDHAAKRKGRFGPALVLALHGRSGPARRMSRLEVRLIRTGRRPNPYEHDAVGNARAINAANDANRRTVRH